MEINIPFHDLQDWPGELPQLRFPKTVTSDLKLLTSFQRPTVKLSIWKRAELCFPHTGWYKKGGDRPHGNNGLQPLPEKDCLKMDV